MDAENANQLQTEIARLNQRIEEYMAAFVGIIEALNDFRSDTAFRLASEQLLPRHAQAATSAASFAEKAEQVRPGHEVDPTA